MLSLAIPSTAILPDRAHCACSRDARGAPGLRQNGSAKFPPCPVATLSPSRPRRATAGPTVLPKWADGLRCVVGAWGARRDLAFALVLAKVVAPAAKRW